MKPQQTFRTATCSCEKLKLECAGEPESVALCHCLDCQRRTGSAFGIAAFYPRQNVRVSGERSLYPRTSEQGVDFSFYFCPSCGGTVFWETSGKKDFIAVAAGAFANPDFPPPTRSYFDEHQPAWLHHSLDD
jgi:hypothetical protein